MSSNYSRKEALELAIRAGVNSANLIGAATEIEKYIYGTNDSEIVAAARAFADIINSKA